MKKIIIITLLILPFILSSCSTSRKCDGGKKIKTQMW